MTYLRCRMAVRWFDVNLKEGFAAGKAELNRLKRIQNGRMKAPSRAVAFSRNCSLGTIVC